MWTGIPKRKNESIPEKKRGTALKAQAGTLQVNANCKIILHAMHTHITISTMILNNS